MRLYGINTCASVKKAKTFFDKNNISYEFIDISKEKPNMDKLSYWQKFQNASSMLNPRSKAYRDKKIKDIKMSDKKAMKFIFEDYSLIKRPIIEHGLNGEEKFYMGYKEEDYIKEFLN